MLPPSLPSGPVLGLLPLLDDAAAGDPTTIIAWGLSVTTIAASSVALGLWRRSRQQTCAIAALDQAHEALQAIERDDSPAHVVSEQNDAVSERLAAIGDVARRLSARGRHLSAIIESEPECVKTVAPDGTLIDMNPAGLALVGATSLEEVRGAMVTDLLLPEWREPYREMHAAVLRGESRTLIFELAGLTGERHWMETHAVPLRDSEGQTIHLAITRDITERRRHETERREALGRAEAASRTKTEFLANMSHELRTPLTAILGYAELLADGESSEEEQARGLHAIHGSANHLLSLISDILDISKIEANRLELESLPCNLEALARDVVEALRGQAEEHGIALEAQTSASVPERIFTDTTRVRQILVNLVGNALKFTQKGSVRVELDALPDGDAGGPDRVEIRVVDTGVGIDAEDLAQLFTPFTQADTSTTRRFGGTGLGLSISRRLARMLGGDVCATSEPGKGSTFTLCLELTPANFVQETTPRAPEANHPSPPAPLPSTRRGVNEQPQTFDGRVLVVEDNPVNRRVLRKLLERLGLEVAEAADGIAGFELAIDSLRSPRPFDLVFLDMHMPIQDGYTTAALLRSEGFPAPVVALTASAMSNDRALCLEAGCDDYASKPVQSATLRRIVARHLTHENAATD